MVEEPESVWDRMGTGFMNTLEGVGEFFKELAVFLVAGSPVIVLLGGIGIGTWMLTRYFMKKSTKKNPPPQNNQ